MLKLLFGFVLGGLATVLVVHLAVLPSVRESYRAVGANDGSILAKEDIANRIKKALGNDEVQGEQTHPLFDVKTISVIVVERNGIKTLRVKE